MSAADCFADAVSPVIARAGSGWQTVLADLSMILFMVTASALRERPPPPDPVRPVILPALGEPVALWRQGAGAPSLNGWIASVAPDPRLRLTIIAEPMAQAEALALAKTAERPARVVIEPGAEGISAALTFDLPIPVAQPLPRKITKESER